MSGVHFIHASLSPVCGSGARQLALLARGLAQQGIPQRAVVASRRTAELLRGVPGLEVSRATTAFSALLACSGPTQILHAHDMPAARVVMMRRRFGGAPCVITQRSLELPAEQRTRLRRTFRRAGRLVGISQAVVDRLRQFDPSLTPVLIPGAASDALPDPWKVERLRRRYAGRCLVGHVGTLDDRTKGQRTLLALARRCVQAQPTLHFLIVGDGPDAVSLQAEARALPNVEFTGWVDDPVNYFHAFDLLVHPARQEALGAQLLDAMAARVPVVATSVGGIPELVPPQTGVLVAPDDVDGLAAQVCRLAADPDRRRRMGEAGRRHAERYSALRMVQSYLRLYGALGYVDPTGYPASRRPDAFGP